MVSADELKVDYLGRLPSLSYPCFLLNSGSVAVYIPPVEGFVIYESGRFKDIGEIMYSSGSGGFDPSRYCGRCPAKCIGNEESVVLRVLVEYLEDDVAPRSLREFLHGVFYDEGKLEYSLNVKEIRLCGDCFDKVESDLNELIVDQSEKITSVNI